MFQYISSLNPFSSPTMDLIQLSFKENPLEQEDRAFKIINEALKTENFTRSKTTLDRVFAHIKSTEISSLLERASDWDLSESEIDKPLIYLERVMSLLPTDKIEGALSEVYEVEFESIRVAKMELAQAQFWLKTRKMALPPSLLEKMASLFMREVKLLLELGISSSGLNKLLTYWRDTSTSTIIRSMAGFSIFLTLEKGVKSLIKKLLKEKYPDEKWLITLLLEKIRPDWINKESFLKCLRPLAVACLISAGITSLLLQKYASAKERPQPLNARSSDDEIIADLQELLLIEGPELFTEEGLVEYLYDETRALVPNEKWTPSLQRSILYKAIENTRLSPFADIDQKIASLESSKDFIIRDGAIQHQRGLYLSPSVMKLDEKIALQTAKRKKVQSHFDKIAQLQEQMVTAKDKLYELTVQVAAVDPSQKKKYDALIKQFLLAQAVYAHSYQRLRQLPEEDRVVCYLSREAINQALDAELKYLPKKPQISSKPVVGNQPPRPQTLPQPLSSARETMRNFTVTYREDLL